MFRGSTEGRAPGVPAPRERDAVSSSAIYSGLEKQVSGEPGKPYYISPTSVQSNRPPPLGSFHFPGVMVLTKGWPSAGRSHRIRGRRLQEMSVAINLQCLPPLGTRKMASLCPGRALLCLRGQAPRPRSPLGRRVAFPGPSDLACIPR